jgi:phage baseplate assembly protein gpV
MGNLFKENKKGTKETIDADGRWLMGVTGIVAENNDPERQHRVKVIIPSIDEDLIYDEWARQFVFCLGDGFGSAFIPPKGAEVVLFGEMGEKFNLFYISLYNEEMLLPEGFDSENAVGIKAPGNMSFIAAQLLKLQAQNIEAIAEQLVKILAQNVEITADETAKVSGSNLELKASENALLKGDSIKIEGGTVRIEADGSITIKGGNITIDGTNVVVKGTSLMLHSRPVNKVGPPI